ncbi:helix-turn-helix domain-containing protein [Salibacterium sp. K-3]
MKNERREYLREYAPEAIQRQTFRNKAEMDAKVDEHIAQHAADLPDTAVEIIRYTSRYSCKYAGVSFLKYATIAAAIGKTRMTVIRNIKKLTAAGIIESLPVMRRVKGGNGANLFVIQPSITPRALPREATTEPPQQAERTSHAESEPLYSENQEIITNNTCQAKQESSYSPSYARFRKVIRQYIDAGQRTISRLYGVYLAQTKYLRPGYEESELIDAAVRALSITFHATKRQHIRNMAGYFNGVLSRLFDRMYEAEVSGMLPA